MSWPYNTKPPRSGGSDNDRINAIFEEVKALIELSGPGVSAEQVEALLDDRYGGSEWRYTVSQIATALELDGTIDAAFTTYTTTVLNPTLITVFANYSTILDDTMDTTVGHTEWSYSIAETEAAIDIDNLADSTTNKMFTATERTKLTGIEASAKDDQTGSEIAALIDTEEGHAEWRNSLAEIEAGLDLDNVPDGGTKVLMTPDERTLLATVQEGATDDLTGSEVVTILNVELGSTDWQGGGGGGAVSEVNGQTGVVTLGPDDLDDSASTNKFTTAGDISKLAGIEAGAEVNLDGDATVTLVNATTSRIPTDTEFAAFGTVKTVNGNSPDGSGAVTISVGGGSGYGAGLVYDTKAEAEAATVGGSVTLIVLTGYYAAGDCKQSRYRKKTAAPTAHGGYIETNDGYFFELEEEEPEPQQFGAKGDFRERADAATISTGDATLTTLTGTITAADVGKEVVIRGAGYHHEAHRTTIASYTNATTCELTDAATYIDADAGTHTGYTGWVVSTADIAISTDDSAAVKDCWNYCRLYRRPMHVNRMFGIMRPEDNLTGSTYLSADADDTNLAIVGTGKNTCGFFYSDGFRYITSSAFFNAAGVPEDVVHKVLFSGFKYRGSWIYHSDEVPHNSSYPSGTQPTYIEQVNGQLTVARGVWDFEISDCAFEDVRGQLTWPRWCNSFRFLRNTVRGVMGGGIIATETDHLMIHDNQVFDCTDDAIMFAGRFDPNDAGFAGTRDITPFHTSVQGNMFWNSGMVKINHAHATVIANNVMMYPKRGGFWIRTEEDVNVRSGVSTITITGNVVSELRDVSEMSDIEGSLGQCFVIDAKSDPGSGTYIPGDGTSSLYDKIHVWNDADETVLPSGPIINVIISDNICARSLAAVTNWSDLDIKTYDSLNRALSALISKENYDMDPAITEDAMRPVGFWIRGPRIRNVMISNNLLAGIGTAFFFGTWAGTGSMAISEMVVENNRVWDVELGINFNIIDKVITGKFRHNVWNIDPLRIRSGRNNSTGAWASASNAPAITDSLATGSFRAGVEFEGETFLNCSEITNGTTDIGRYNFINCVIEADIVAVGFSTSNKGVGRLPAGSPAFRIVDIDGTATSATFLQTTNKALVTATVPASGAVHVVGERVGIEGAVIGGGLSLLHHQYTTTGSGSTLGTDVAAVAGLVVSKPYVHTPGGIAVTVGNNAATSITGIPTGMITFITCPVDPTCTWAGLLVSGTQPLPLTALPGTNIAETTGVLTGGGAEAASKLSISMVGTTLYIGNKRGSSRTLYLNGFGTAGFTL